MFGFGKKEPVSMASPLKGKIIDITEVSDHVFADKVMGDGFAVMPGEGEDTVLAPCDGKVMLVADTRHAVAIGAGSKYRLELLIHVGLETAALNGEGFTALVKKGDKVKRGDPLIRFDRGALIKKGKSLTTMLVVTNADDAAQSMEKNLGDADKVLTVTLK